MSVKELFEGHSREEVEELFDVWARRGFEDIPTDTFFAALEEIGAYCLPQHVEMEGEVVGNVQPAVPSETSDVTNVERK
jgi:hypothetical protein